MSPFFKALLTLSLHVLLPPHHELHARHYCYFHFTVMKIAGLFEQFEPDDATRQPWNSGFRIRVDSDSYSIRTNTQNIPEFFTYLRTSHSGRPSHSSLTDPDLFSLAFWFQVSFRTLSRGCKRRWTLFEFHCLALINFVRYYTFWSYYASIISVYLVTPSCANLSIHWRWSMITSKCLRNNKKC